MGKLASHTECVDAWMARATTAGISSEGQVALFERAFKAVWAQAYQTLGETTLTAIVDRVLTTSTARFPLLAQIQVEHSGITCGPLNGKGTSRPAGEALRFTLIELLRVLGSVTGEILTPSLHAALADVTARQDDENQTKLRQASSGSEAPSK